MKLSSKMTPSSPSAQQQQQQVPKRYQLSFILNKSESDDMPAADPSLHAVSTSRSRVHSFSSSSSSSSDAVTPFGNKLPNDASLPTTPLQHRARTTTAHHHDHQQQQQLQLHRQPAVAATAVRPGFSLTGLLSSPPPSPAVPAGVYSMQPPTQTATTAGAAVGTPPRMDELRDESELLAVSVLGLLRFSSPSGAGAGAAMTTASTGTNRQALANAAAATPLSGPVASAPAVSAAVADRSTSYATPPASVAPSVGAASAQSTSRASGKKNGRDRRQQTGPHRDGQLMVAADVSPSGLTEARVLTPTRDDDIIAGDGRVGGDFCAASAPARAPAAAPTAVAAPDDEALLLPAPPPLLFHPLRQQPLHLFQQQHWQQQQARLTPEIPTPDPYHNRISNHSLLHQYRGQYEQQLQQQHQQHQQQHQQQQQQQHQLQQENQLPPPFSPIAHHLTSPKGTHHQLATAHGHSRTAESPLRLARPASSPLAASPLFTNAQIIIAKSAATPKTTAKRATTSPAASRVTARKLASSSSFASTASTLSTTASPLSKSPSSSSSSSSSPAPSSVPSPSLSSTIPTLAYSSAGAPKGTSSSLSPTKLYHCTYPSCHKSFKNAHSLRSHSRCHGEPKFPCDRCPAQFRRKHDLHRHGRSLHHTAKPHQCGGCGKLFPRADALRRHLTSRSVTHGCAAAAAAAAAAGSGMASGAGSPGLGGFDGTGLGLDGSQAYGGSMHEGDGDDDDDDDLDGDGMNEDEMDEPRIAAPAEPRDYDKMD
ncbi:hypothetical protein DFJ73DRAFT_779212 [Zopfochytrium polystomum]|nr:hypothetical protein DFJ73DRAFT_779212 [Zopfochytrium polystomum]